ncbi:hypothetical protein KMW28_27210 [Flammeovirga yaeyamensis]|uniref:7(1) septoil knot domain-containing protein n=1 Tax=Flammeovirga yaeyamensis TaxID=367791 RepID=A0AAX1NAK2_9BACT|nr:DUF6150 family protein [Flammeovirga yaeyamensis]MBB3700030.1 hypothetical protein [Flammeovirga yaeyamensis]NMF37533.1 hypothetical protein [Flammeovirga yaeyamensis]QWG04590.1 hypothetical protein KMW28_27210 [Flammeovirga yaeyamensis]
MFIVAQRHQADVIVTTVQQRHQADVVIAPNSWKGDWQLVDQKWQADKLIYITSKSWEADVKVFFE